MISDNQNAVVVAKDAAGIEVFAAAELCKYLRLLFGTSVDPVTSVPKQASNIFLIGNAAARYVPAVSDQGIVLKRVVIDDGRSAMIVAGGSAQATLWAVYELVERWGVRYLVGGDAIPEGKRTFALPDLDEVMEPVFRIRARPTIQDFVCSGECWGLDDFKSLIDYLAKQKFNRVNVFTYGWQPFLDWSCNGIKRQNAWLWYNDHYPITSDMIGRSLFDDRSEFWNPDLPLNASYEEFAAAGEKLVHGVMAYAHSRGMECVIYADLTQFPPEFGPLLHNSQTVNQVGSLTVVPGGDTPANDPKYYAVALAVLESTLRTYPEADMVAIGMPEWRQWVGVYKEAWEELDAKYQVSKVTTLEQVLQNAANRPWGRGADGQKKAQDEVKGDLAMFVFYDRLLHDPTIASRLKRHRLMYNCVVEELFPLLSQILPPGAEVDTIVDNFPTQILKRREVFTHVPSQDIPAIMNLTIDDDNVGVVPQLSTGILHELMKDMRDNKWAGFVARERFPADHDSALAYLARAAWDANAHPEQVIREQVRAACGVDCEEDMLTVFREVEAVTALLEREDWDFSFPLRGMIMQYWDGRCFCGVLGADGGGGPLLNYTAEAKRRYEVALAAANRVRAKVHGRRGKASDPGTRYAEFWVGRITFALRYMQTIDVMRLGGIAESDGKHDVAVVHAREAMRLMEEGLSAYASVAWNATDRGTIALVNEHGWRGLKRKVSDLEALLIPA